MFCLVRGGPLGSEGSGGSRSEAVLGLSLGLLVHWGQLTVPNSRPELDPAMAKLEVRTL